MKKEFIIKNGVLKEYIGNGGNVVIPNDITKIGNFAFYKCKSLTSVVIPEKTISIGKYAFYGCSSLTSVVIPNSVTHIGAYAFSDCDSLTSVVTPNSVTSIGYRAFYECSSLTDIVVPDNIVYMGEDVFAYCKDPSRKKYNKLSWLNNIEKAIKKCKCSEEERKHLATEQQIMNTSVIIRDFLQEKNISRKDIYKFLNKKKLNVLDLENAKNQFINYAICGKKTELVKEFFEEVK